MCFRTIFLRIFFRRTKCCNFVQHSTPYIHPRSDSWNWSRSSEWSEVCKNQAAPPEPDQTAPSGGAVWSGSTLFAQICVWKLGIIIELGLKTPQRLHCMFYFMPTKKFMSFLIEPCHEKTCFQGLQPDKTQTDLLSYSDQLEAWNWI